MAAAPSTLTPPIGGSAAVAAALHLATSRSATIRLRPVADALRALGVTQALAHAAGSAEQVASATETAIRRARPAAAFIAGDGAAAVTAALVCQRLGVAVARVGAGLRCGDRSVHEEINRIVLDGLADRLYVDGEDAAGRLRTEGIAAERIRSVGSTLADVVARWSAGRPAAPATHLPAGGYVLAALHRPENIADDERLARIVEALAALAARAPVVICLHEATRAAMQLRGDLTRLRTAGVALREPLAHAEFLSLQANAGAVVTDSAGVQEETTLLGAACFTARRVTERTLTLTHGTNVLLGDDAQEIAAVPLRARVARPRPIPLWDGRAGERIAADFASGAWR
jgi:UDP-N-acetylglucosamine 2-epimerase (non-hydrolysing)